MTNHELYERPSMTFYDYLALVQCQDLPNPNQKNSPSNLNSKFYPSSVYFCTKLHSSSDYLRMTCLRVVLGRRVKSTGTRAISEP